MSTVKRDSPPYLEDFLNHIRVIEDRSPRTEEAYYTDMKTFLRYLLIDHNFRILRSKMCLSDMLRNSL